MNVARRLRISLSSWWASNPSSANGRAVPVKLWRRLLVVLMAAVVLAVAFNYFHLWRNRNHTVKQVAQILSSEMMRSADSIEYSQHDKGALRFKIKAEKLLETRQGKNLLQGIEAFDFTADGLVRNEIRSRNAEYDPIGQRVLFSQDVRLKIGGGSELRTESLRYDLQSNVGETDEKLRFSSGQMNGDAKGLRYDNNHQTMELKSESNFNILRDIIAADGSRRQEQLNISSQTVFYSEADQVALFKGNARLKTALQLLSADAIEARLDGKERRVKSLLAQGNAEYQFEDVGQKRTMRGNRIAFGIDAAKGALETIAVEGKAGFLTDNPEGQMSLRGEAIDIRVDTGNGLPSALHSQSDVELRIRQADEEVLVRGAALDADFQPNTASLARMHVDGQASLKRTGSAATGSDVLRADDLKMAFRDISGRTELYDLAAQGSVQWSTGNTKMVAGSRSLSAAVLKMTYAEKGNFLETADASGNVIIVESPSGSALPSEMRQMRANKVVFRFYPGANMLKTMVGEGDVRMNYRTPAHTAGKEGDLEYRTSSAKMEATFLDSDGTADKVSQWGSCTLEDGMRTIRAGRCDYDARHKTLMMRENPSIDDVNGYTTGEVIEYDRALGVLLVRKHVRSVVMKQGPVGATLLAPSGSTTPSVITAEEMRYWFDSGRVRYEQNVQMLSDRGQLQASTIEILAGGAQIDAQGAVRHLIPQTEENGGRRGDRNRSSQSSPGRTQTTVVVNSTSLTYSSSKNSISYLGHVTLQSTDLNISSESLDAWWDKSGKQIDRAKAQGHVVMKQAGREARGDSADWDVVSGKFVVLGNLAQLLDPIKGKSSARRLTFHTSDDRILLDNQ